ncbi:carbohydrate kinase family protein [Hoeflea sp.]|uniref:carbohydrate kinase family protein n=1 Tax=Hoeflea sp. TaxID=1940281 RepID=UPI003B02EC8C
MTVDNPRFDAVFAGLTILDIAGRPVSSIPDGGGIAFVEEIRMNPAGTASGALMNAAKLGISCATSACLGRDEKGDFIENRYRAMGIDCSLLQRTGAMATSATILPIRPNGERPALHCRGASDEWWLDESEFDALCDTRFLHHGGTGFLAKMDRGQSAKLLAHAKARGLTVTLDLIGPNDETLGQLKDLMPHVDYFMPSMEEALFIAGTADPSDAAARFRDLGATACIFKWGEKGSFISTADGDWRLPAFKVNVSDTTGCGDAYCGGFIAGLSMGYDLEEACRLGTAVSGLVATGLGSDAGVVDLESTLEFIRTASILDDDNG